MKEKITDNYRVSRQISMVGNKRMDVMVISLNKDKVTKTSSLKKVSHQVSKRPTRGCSGCSRNRTKKRG